MEYIVKKLKTLLFLLAFLVCVALVVIGQRTISYMGAGTMMLGLAGMLALLNFYNRKHR